jgi:hypothetical protein
MPNTYIKRSHAKQVNNLPFCESKLGWDEAIQHAKRLLSETKLRAARLRHAIKMFETKSEAGEVFPGLEHLLKDKRTGTPERPATQ